MSAKFGYVSEESYPAIAKKFAMNIAKKKFIGNKCTTCDKKYFPPRTACEDFHETMEDYPVNNVGELKAWTIIHFAPENMADRAPYAVGIAELEPGIRVLAQIPSLMQKPKIGMKLELQAQQVDAVRFTYKWVVIKD